MGLTITEALAEIKTIGKRLAKKRETVGTYLARPMRVIDPLQEQGGSLNALKAERQAIADLEERVVDLRLAIADANFKTEITVEGETRTIQEWLTWRREVAPGRTAFLGALRQRIEMVRREAASKGLNVTAEGGATAGMNDVLVSIDEKQLAADMEHLEKILGVLDGQLSLKNATTTIEDGAAPTA